MEVKGSFEISVVIPTLGRYASVRKLIDDLHYLGEIIGEIVVVDSTHEGIRESLKSYNKIVQVFTPHQNGLYQRFLGSKIARYEWILFLDNDMELVKSPFFEDLNQLVCIEGLSGIALKFADKHDDTTLNKIPKSKLPTSGFISKAKGILTAYPILPVGCYGYCGIRGPQPNTFSKTQWLSGGAFFVKRELVFKGLNFKLISYFEQQLGMGEDPLIGYMLSLHGQLFRYPELCFLHNDQKDSAYSVDLYNYSRRVVFSRLYLSLERARLSNTPKLIGYFYYHWHTFFRVFGLLINTILNKSEDNLKMLNGGVRGWSLSFRSGYRYSSQDEQFWLQRINKDLENAGL